MLYFSNALTAIKTFYDYCHQGIKFHLEQRMGIYAPTI